MHELFFRKNWVTEYCLVLFSFPGVIPAAREQSRGTFTLIYIDYATYLLHYVFGLTFVTILILIEKLWIRITRKMTYYDGDNMLPIKVPW